MSDAGELDLNSLNDEDLVQQVHDDLYDGLKEEVEDGRSHPARAAAGRPTRS